MYQVTLIGAPNQERLNMTVLDSLRHAWGGGDAVWLSHAEAAEFPLKPSQAISGRCGKSFKTWA